MERIKQRLMELLNKNKIKEIYIDIVSISNQRYIGFETSEGAIYTFILTKEGNCTYSNNCKGQLYKIVEGLASLQEDLDKLEKFSYIDTYCEECILASLEDDNFEQYNNFCI